MKKRILLFLFAFMVSCLFSDTILITITPEGVETVTENTELILSDPFVEEIITGTTEPEEKTEDSEEAETGKLIGFKIGIEMTVTGPTKAISLPLGYTFKKISFGITLPYILKREMKYLLETKTASGFGDISFKVGSNKWIKNVNFGLNIQAKLPTGDSENMEDGYLVPLGTGSTDLVVSLSAFKYLQKYSLSGNLTYKLNGISEKTAELLYDDMDNNPATDDIETIKYDIHNGNMLIFKGNFDYYLNKWTVGGLLVFSTTGEGSKDIIRTNNWEGPTVKENDISNLQDMTLLDIIPMVSYRLLRTDITLLAKIPVYTKRNEANDEDERKLVVSFKIGRKF